MEASHTSSEITVQSVQDWLVDKLAQRLTVDPASISVDQYFDEFNLDSTEALILAGELEGWLGFELETTALWYHPTVASLAQYIVEEHAGRAGA
jgi:acyl carrier protein